MSLPERPTDQELLALANLRENPHFSVLMEWLKRWEEKEVRECIEAEKTRLNQGRAQVLIAIREASEEAATNYRGRVARKAVRGANSANAF